ncbi:MAG: SDR family oxidoreductase [Anaerolineae bacterium]|nr:SDR family oxidoreductase [Anaerolineae bacterium]
MVSGRSQSSVDSALAQLTQSYPADRIFAKPCDVTQLEQVQALWDAARAHFDHVDVWINNAGLSNSAVPFWELDGDEIAAVVDTNLKGSMYGSKVAISGMLEQGGGQVYNMEGFGSDGRTGNFLTLYGSTKYSLKYFTRSLIEETKTTPVQVCYLSPGMVVTDMLMAPYEGKPQEYARAKRVLNILADKVETVTPYLAQKILENNQHGAKIAWLDNKKIFLRFLTAPFVKRNVLD